MRGIHIVGTGRALPEKILTNEDMSRLVDTSDEWIVTRTPKSGRAYLRGGDLCVTRSGGGKKSVAGSGGKGTGKTGGNRSGGRCLPATSDYDFPSTACLVQKELGLSSETMAFDLAAACSGFLYGLEVCRRTADRQQGKYVLFDRQRAAVKNYGLHGPSDLYSVRRRGGCCGPSEGRQPLCTSGMVERQKQRVIVLRGCGNRWSKTENGWLRGVPVRRPRVTQGMEDVLMEAGVRLEEVDHVICHQANRRIIEHVMKKYPGQEDKFYINIERYGNTSAGKQYRSLWMK